MTIMVIANFIDCTVTKYQATLQMPGDLSWEYKRSNYRFQDCVIIYAHNYTNKKINIIS